MDVRECTDQELMEHARNGMERAFAVLFFRHVHHVWSALAHDDTAEVQASHSPHEEQAIAVFSSLMRTLSRREPLPGDVRAWLDTEITHRADQPVAPASETTSECPSHTIDQMWNELSARWPMGRAAPRFPRWLPWVATVAITVALSAGIPWWLLGPDAPQEQLLELRAFPIVEQRAEAEPREPIEDAPLPTFEFPVPPEEIEPPPPHDSADALEPTPQSDQQSDELSPDDAEDTPDGTASINESDNTDDNGTVGDGVDSTPDAGTADHDAANNADDAGTEPTT